MSSPSTTENRLEFGDFQTPRPLAMQICRFVVERFGLSRSVLEPTCGRGEFLSAALDVIPSLEHAIGVDINASHVAAAQASLRERSATITCEVRLGDFFATDWALLVQQLPDPLLVIGNPPWVTNSAISVARGSNLPLKSNFQRHAGLDAVTGKSNFDISEWMLLHLAKTLKARKAIMAVLCKTTVARKVLVKGWRQGLFGKAELRLIDAKRHFEAAVDACLFCCQFNGAAHCTSAEVYADLEATSPTQVLGLRDDRLVSNLEDFEATRHLAGKSGITWRSGIKHDCSPIMELRTAGNLFRNGLGELVELESDFVFPMLKSSNLAKKQTETPSRWMIVTQRTTGDDTRAIEIIAPRTWQYLQRHSARLDRRASTIYRGRPPFAVFGVGNYSFSPNKVAVSALYKHLTFVRLREYKGKPLVLDDTCCFMACACESEAVFISELLSSDVAQSFYGSRIFWDSKRPITTEVLNQLDIAALANETFPQHPVTIEWNSARRRTEVAQASLF